MASKFTVTEVDISSVPPYWNENHWPYKLKSEKLLYRKIKISHVEFFTLFSPAIGEPKARLLFVHGFGEYHKAYEEFYDDLSAKGYEVFFYDQRGAGLTSSGKYRGFTNDHYTFKDLDNFVEFNYEEKNDSIPLYLAGHSMGGGIILNYLIRGRHRNLIKGGICTAPLVTLHPATKPSIVLEKALVFVSKFKENLSFDTKLDKRYLTTDEAYRDFLLNDPLIKPVGTIGQLRDMIFRGRDLLKPQLYKNFDDTKSLLILHSDEDHINWCEGSREFFAKLNEEFPETKSSRKLIRYQGLGHSLLLETEIKRAEIVNEIVQFLDNDIKA